MSEIEVYRGVVAPEDIDRLGHMNVSRYLGICGDGMFAMQARFGLDLDDVLNGRRVSFAVVKAECDFLSEIREGEEVTLRVGLLEIGTKSALFRHRLFAGEDGRLAFRARFRSALMDLAARRAVAIPPDIRAALETIRVEGDE